MKFNLNMCQYVHFKVFFCPVIIASMLIGSQNDKVEAKELRSPAIDFERHSIVQPVLYHGRTKREINSTKDTTGEHHKQVTVKMDIDGEEYLLDLVLNEDLVTKDYVISYQKNGQKVLYRPTKEDLDICQYGGTVRGKPGSWVAVSTCHGISGVIHYGNTTNYIEPAEDNEVDTLHYIYDHSNLNMTYHQGRNSVVDDQQLLLDHPSELDRTSRYKRQAYNTMDPKRYMELVLVVDNTEFRAHGGKVQSVNVMLKDITNILNSLFAPLNIVIALAGVEIWSEVDQIPLDVQASNTLYNFMGYRRRKLLPNMRNDHAHLITHQLFTDSILGATLRGFMCSDDYSAGISTRYSLVNGLVAATIAHEIGHSLGMIDDLNNCHCPDGNCIMNSYSHSFRIAPTMWSDCSVNSLQYAFATGKDYCLRNKPETVCGNGIIEAGEQCDCGLKSAVNSLCNACCHPRHCTLRRTELICTLGLLLSENEFLSGRNNYLNNSNTPNSYKNPLIVVYKYPLDFLVSPPSSSSS